MDNYRNALTDEIKTLSAEEARERNPNVWVIVTELPPKKKSTKTTPDSKEQE